MSIKANRVLTIVVVVLCVYQVSSQAAQPAAGAPTTATTRPQHPFCTRVPNPQTPKIEIFSMDVRTGFYNGYRSNQSVI
ncbi:hypothetical protein BaRGS_00010788, partial [Batillaria attramentaria]